jgi:hypothetical protein
VPADGLVVAGLRLVMTHSPGCRSMNSKLTFAPGLSAGSKEGLAALNSMVMAGHFRLGTGP